MSPEDPPTRPPGTREKTPLPAFSSALVDRLRRQGGVWSLPAGEIRLPEAFGFCRGVKRALSMVQQAVDRHPRHPGTLLLLGQIIHNPWVNAYFEERGVRILTRAEVEQVERHVGPGDCAIIPAFGVPLPVRTRLEAIGCNTVDTTCGDVRRLWVWAKRAARDGCGVMIFGRPDHDETVVTKSLLDDAGGRYVVVSSLARTRRFCELIEADAPADRFRAAFGPETTNAESLRPFERLAQVSQTTMLYDETMQVREVVCTAFARRFGPDAPAERLAFQPTVCRATQARQAAAVELCRGGCDLIVVVGGFGSSNTRHLYELARQFAPAWFVEDAAALRSADELATIDLADERPVVATGWLPSRRPLRIGLLAGASSPEVVLGEVLERLASFLG